MDDAVEVAILVDAEAAKVLASPALRAAVGRHLSKLLKAPAPAMLLRGRSPRPSARSAPGG